MALLYSNNASSTLAADLTLSGTTLSLFAGTGVLFPEPTGGDYFKITLEDSVGNVEIVHCNARSGDSCTIVRAQEGTIARAFSTGAAAENRFTAGSIASFNSYSMASNAEATAGTATNVIMNPAATKYFWDQRVTAFGESIINDTDAAGARTTLGLGDAALGTIGTTVQAYDADTAKTDVTNAYTAQQFAAPVALTGQTGTVTLDANVHQDVSVAATGNIIFAAPTNAATGKMIFLTLTAGSALTLTWNAVFKASADVELPAAFTASKNIYLNFRCYDGTNWVLLGLVTGA